MSYQSFLAYFMSGTGNSYRVANWTADAARERGMESRAIPVEEADPATDMRGGPDSLVGIVFPTHGFTAPWHLLKFAARLPMQKGTQAFCIATRGRTKIGFFLPGLAGSAPFIIALLLWLKGFRVRGVIAIDMPSNWMSLHWGLHPSNVAEILERAGRRTRSFIEPILSGRRYWLSVSNAYDFLCGAALLPVSAGYLIVGRYFLAKLFFANNNCKSCAACEKHCPVNAIVMWGKKRPRPFWKHNCESCMRCMAYCPKNAIEAGQSWGVLLYYSCVPVSTLVAYQLLAWVFPHFDGDADRWRVTLVAAVVMPFPIFVAYWLFSLLNRIPIVNTLFAYTTLTHVYRRYHEPTVKLRHLGRPRHR